MKTEQINNYQDLVTILDTNCGLCNFGGIEIRIGSISKEIKEDDKRNPIITIKGHILDCSYSSIIIKVKEYQLSKIKIYSI